MGHKRLLDDSTNGEVEVTKKNKKQKNDETLDDTIQDEAGNTEQNGQISLPKTRRDLMELPYEEKLKFVSVIANPMANKKFAKKLFKLMRKASKLDRKSLLRIGLKDVQLRIRKGERGLVVFAGDVTPIEIMCHMPAVCEDKDIPYVYVPFRTDISAAIGVRRPALMVLIKKHDDYADVYDECEAKMREFMLSVMQ